MELGEVIRDAMASKGLSLRATASLSGVSVGYLSEILGARTKPGEMALRKIASTLELDPDRLVIMAGKLFAVGSTRRIAAELLEKNKKLEARLEAGQGARVAS